MSIASARLREARIRAGFKTAAAASQAQNWPASAYRHHENGTRSFDADQARIYGLAYTVSASWLLGLAEEREISPFHAFANSTRYSPDNQPGWFKSITAELTKHFHMLIIPEAPIGMEYVVFEESEDEYANMFQGFSITDLSSVAKMGTEWLRAIRVDTDDMSPTVRSGALLVVDLSQREILQQDHIWALTYASVGLVRRVRRHADGTLECLADGMAAPPLRVAEADIEVFGKAVWVSQPLK